MDLSTAPAHHGTAPANDAGQPLRYGCAKCPKTFRNSQALNCHSRVHRDDWEASKKVQRKAHAGQSAAFRSAYDANPRFCLCCSKRFTHEQVSNNPGRLFCNSSCSARHFNAQRGGQAPQTRQRIRGSLLARAAQRTPTPSSTKARPPRARSVREVVGPFSKLKRNTCRHCGVVWMARATRMYCSAHAHLYSAVARQGYLFAFNPFQFPDVFTPEELAWCAKVGPYSHSNRLGWTRDHKVSVNEAIRHGYDAFYIRHPVNCELMGFDANNRKKAQSSWSYAQLVQVVDAYETRKLGLVA